MYARDCEARQIVKCMHVNRIQNPSNNQLELPTGSNAEDVLEHNKSRMKSLINMKTCDKPKVNNPTNWVDKILATNSSIPSSTQKIPQFRQY